MLESGPRMELKIWAPNLGCGGGGGGGGCGGGWWGWGGGWCVGSSGGCRRGLPFHHLYHLPIKTLP